MTHENTFDGATIPRTGEFALSHMSHLPTPSTAKNSARSQRSSNLFLQALPFATYQKWQPQLQRVLIHQGQILVEQGALADYIYFIEKGAVSLVACLGTGFQSEGAIVGQEGWVGAAPCPDVPSCWKAVVQVPGKALRLPISLFQQECQSHGSLQNFLWTHNNLVIRQTAQNMLCVRTHTLRERLCRWLLTLRDRTDDREMELTHFSIASFLGTRRSGVTVALGQLQEQGMLEISRNRLILTDTAKMEIEACECYGIIREAFHDWRVALNF